MDVSHPENRNLRRLLNIMTELERQETVARQIAYQAQMRVVERRGEVMHRLNELTAKPQRDWTHTEKVEISNLLKRLKILVDAS